MQSAVTFSAVEQARGGPFVLWDSFPKACSLASELGFDGIEVFAESAAYFMQPSFKATLEESGLSLAAAGTGAGWVVHKLTLSHPDSVQRRKAIDFVKSIIDAVAPWQTQVIIGSMQGRAEVGMQVNDLRSYLADSLRELAEHASERQTRLLIEPLNRYETNIINSVEDGKLVLAKTEHANVKLLCDIFHMNIEEPSITGALEAAGKLVGHVHFADSNRWAVGFGHIHYPPIIDALVKIGYKGFLSAEVFSKPDADAASRQSILAFQSLIQVDASA